VLTHGLACFLIYRLSGAILHIVAHLLYIVVFHQSANTCTSNIILSYREAYHHILNRELIGQTVKALYNLVSMPNICQAIAQLVVEILLGQSQKVVALTGVLYVHNQLGQTPVNLVGFKLATVVGTILVYLCGTFAILRAHIINSVLCVKYRQEIFGGGLVLAHVITLRILKPSVARALATEKIL